MYVRSTRQGELHEMYVNIRKNVYIRRHMHDGEQTYANVLYVCVYVDTTSEVGCFVSYLGLFKPASLCACVHFHFSLSLSLSLCSIPTHVNPPTLLLTTTTQAAQNDEGIARRGTRHSFSQCAASLLTTFCQLSRTRSQSSNEPKSRPRQQQQPTTSSTSPSPVASTAPSSNDQGDTMQRSVSFLIHDTMLPNT